MLTDIKNQAVILLSGGIKSTMCAYYAQNMGWNIKLMHINYDQRATIPEMSASQQIARSLKTTIKFLDLSSLRALFRVNARTSQERYQRVARREEWIIPNLYSLFMQIGITYAVKIGASNVILGLKANNVNPILILNTNQLIGETLYPYAAINLRVLCPLLVDPYALDVMDIIKLIDFKQTWDCYDQGPLHCGICLGCRERKAFFLENHYEDGTEYEN